MTGLNGDVYTSFDHLITERHAIPDERFQRFISILQGEKLNATNAQLKRDREKLLNQELGPKSLDGTPFPYGKWELHWCVYPRTGESIYRPKRDKAYTGGKQAMVPASEIEAIISKVHMLGGHKGQERTWKDIARVYNGIPQNLVKAYVKNCSCTSGVPKPFPQCISVSLRIAPENTCDSLPRSDRRCAYMSTATRKHSASTAHHSQQTKESSLHSCH
jgi:hypothetical protein